MNYKAFGLRRQFNGCVIATCTLSIPPDINCPEKLMDWVKTQKMVYDEVLLMNEDDFMRLFW